MNHILEQILAFLVSCGMTVLVLPRILEISFKKRLFDSVDARKVHTGIVPRLGGVAFFPSILFTMGLLAAIHVHLIEEISLSDVVQVPQLLLGMCALILIFLTGIVDDLIGMPYKSKFLMQISCGVLLVVSGEWFNDFYGILGIHAIPWWIGMPLTIFITVFITNAINLIDGIDGLASGLSAIAMLLFGLLFMYQGEWAYSLLAFATLGALVPFFCYNVFGKSERRTKIFMGDTGALTVGLILSMLAIRFSMSDNPPNVHHMEGAIVIAFSMLMVPMLDVIRVVIARLKVGADPFKPDRNHIHHRFLALGFTPRRAMVTIIGISAAFAGINILLAPYIDNGLLLVFDVAAWMMFNFLITVRIKNNGEPV